MANETTKAKIVKELKRIEEDAKVTSKSHYNTSQHWSRLHLTLGIPATIISALGAVFALSEYTVVAGILAILAAVITGLITFLNPNERANRHQSAGAAYNELRNNARIVGRIDTDNLDDLALAEEMKKLNRTRSELNKESPQPSRRAFEKARKGIEEGEAEYKADKPSN